MTGRQRRVVVAAGALGLLLAIVGGIALLTSYWHARALAYAYRSPSGIVPDLSALLPLTTDGLLFGAFAVIYWRRLAQLAVPRLAWIGAGLAGLATVAANLAIAYPSVTGWIVAGWAPVTFTLVDFLAAILIPPLVKAWRDARDVTPPPNRDTPTIAMTAPPERTGAVIPDRWIELPPVSTLRAPESPDDPRPGTDDEAVTRLQAEIDAGELDGIPRPRYLRTRWGFHHDKAVRIITRLRERAS